MRDHIFWMIMILLVPAVLATAGDDPLAPGLQRALGDDAAPARSADGTFAVWVHFTDKGLTGAALQDALRKAERDLGERARKRRAKVSADKSGRLVDPTDLPLHRPYVKAVAATGAAPRQESRWLNAASFNATPAQIRTLATLPFVRRVDLVRRSSRRPLPVTPAPKTDTPDPDKSSAYTLDYGNSLAELEQIHVPEVHEAGWYGQGVLIGMLDTGFSLLHEALTPVNVIGAWDFVNNDGVVDNEVGDDNASRYHGTMTLSTVGGYHPGTLVGPAYGASYVLAKTEDVTQEVPAEEDNWVAGIEWLDTFGIDIASSSLGYHDWYEFADMDGNTAPCTIAADLAVAKGIVVVSSAGNERSNPWGHIIAPADGDSVIATGAVGTYNNVASFSSPGPSADGRIKPDVSARGVSNHVADPYNPTSYLSVSGTSFSCPLTSGVAALILSRAPDLAPMQVLDALRMTASQSLTPDNDLGWGVIDAWEAVHYFGPNFTHSPLTYTTDVVGPYTMILTITDRVPLVTGGEMMHWRVDGGPWQDVALTHLSGAYYTGAIPGQPDGSDVAYWFEAYDEMGLASVFPAGAPEVPFAFHVGQDLTPPVLIHTPLSDQPLTTWPPLVKAYATDNLAMGTVDVSWALNGAVQADFSLVEGASGSWAGVFPLGQEMMAVGDSVTYTITAVDLSAGANTSVSGPHSFAVIEALGVVLVVDNTAESTALDVKRDDAKALLPPAVSTAATSAADITRWLRSAGYAVYEKPWADFSELDLEGIQMLVVAAGGNTGPIADAAQRGDVRRWAEQGGRLFLEGGELGSDAMNTPGYPDFADTAMHISAWRGDAAGALQLTAGLELHPLANTPHVLPVTLGLDYAVYGDQDALDPDPSATIVFGTTAFAGAAGLLAYDDTPAPQAGQTVLLACNLAALADSVTARHLVENVAAWLVASEGADDGSLSGTVSFLIGDVVMEMPGAVVSLQTGQTAVTGVDGAWSLDGLSAGAYRLTVRADGFVTQVADIVLAESEAATLEFTLFPAVTTSVVWAGPLAIPDGETTGLSATVDVGDFGGISEVTVSVDLTHPWIGDLVVELASPLGTVVRLHDRSGGGIEDIVGTWDTTLDVDGPGALTDFLDEEAFGTWTLRVSDRVAGDTGTLNGWTLHVVRPAPPLGVDEPPPLRTALGAAAPNPFNPRTEIRFSLARAATPRLEVFDLKGRRVRTLLSDMALPAGNHAVTWLGRTDAGREASSGIYLIRLRAAGVLVERKVTLAR